MIRSIAAFGAVAGLCAFGPTHLGAQIRGSEHTALVQTVDGTTIKLEYSRPVARGRDLFGKLVPWNIVWTPGANWATTLEVDRPVRLNGTDVPAGKYSVWMIPRQSDWTLFLDRNAKLFHFQKPDSTAQQIHIAVQPEQGAHTEMLTWSFPAVSGDAARLQMQWGSTTVPLQVVVQPTRPVQLTPEDRALYVGSYDMRMMEGLGWPATGRLDVFEKDGMLRGRLPFPIHPGDELEFDLVPAGNDRFNPGLYREARLFNVEIGASFEFDVAGGHASAVRLRGIEGTVFGEGPRAGG
ncbi:MAG: DUF2911 domain-containing protein [Longimicrobiales bacterium]